MTNWEMLAAIGQLAAVFIGIPSLIYLAIQIREQTKERRQSAVHALTEQWAMLRHPCTIMPKPRRFICAACSLSAISTLCPNWFCASKGHFDAQEYERQLREGV